MPVVQGYRADTKARQDLKELNADSGEVMTPGKSKYVDGTRWTNNTAGDLIIPSPTDEATMLAAGFTLATGGSSQPSQPSHPTTAIDITYADLHTLVENSTAVLDQWYRITDFTTINSSHWGTLNTAAVEPLYVRAIQTDKIDTEAYSSNHTDDLIKYNFTDNKITEAGDGSWEDGADDGGSIACSNWTSNTFDVDRELIVDSGFYVSAEDDDGDIEYEAADEGVTFTVTDLGGGSTRFTDLTGNINFTHPDYNYGEISSSYKIASTKGRIFEREYPPKHIKCTFDFRGVRYARKRIDAGGIPSWSAGAYTRNDIVQHNGYIYKCMQDTSEATHTNYWIRVASNLDHSYLWVDTWSGLSIPLDATPVMVPVFSYWDGAAFVEDYSRVSDVFIESEDVVFNRHRANTQVVSVNVAENASQLSFGGSIQNVSLSRYTRNTVFDFNSNTQSVTLQDGLVDCIISGALRDSSLIKITSSIIGYVSNAVIGHMINSDLRYCNRVSIGSNMSHVRLGNVSDTVLGSNGSNSYFYASYHNQIGDSFNNITTLINSFSNNHIGDLWRGFRIEANFNYNTIGTTVGCNSNILTVDHIWMNNTIGNYCFQSTTGNHFGGSVQGMSIGNNVDRLDFSGSASNSVIGNGCSRITCDDFFNVEMGPLCRVFNFTGNIQQCSFASGVTNLTYLSASAFRNNHIKSGHITIDPANPVVTSNTVCSLYRTSDGDRRMSYMDDDDHYRLIDPTDSSDVLEYRMPVTDGEANQVLLTDGSGNMSWAYMVVPTTYINTDKNGIWTITKSSNNIWHAGHDDVTKLIDGGDNNDTYFENGVNVLGEWLEVDFGEPKQVDKMKWTQGNSTAHGTWKMQGYNGTAWADISPEFTLGGYTTSIYGTTWDGKRYQRVRIIGVSGQVSSSPWLYEINYKINT